MPAADGGRRAATTCVLTEGLEAPELQGRGWWTRRGSNP